MILLLLLGVGVVRGDLSPILYPGQVNIGFLADIHQRGASGECGPLRPHAVQRAMAAVWAAHQANFGDPRALNIGVYIYDTCGRNDIAVRQAYRLLAHVVPPDCSSQEKNNPPLVAVLTEGDMESLGGPLKLFSAFSVPVITATGTPDIAAGLLSTALSTPALARGAVSVLHQLRLLEVAVVTEEDDSLFAHFSTQVAHVTGMQATHVQGDEGTTNDDALTTFKLISKQSRLKAVVFLVSSEEAHGLLLQVADEPPQIPWLVITPSDISARIVSEQGKNLRKVLLLSPESPSSPSFEEYFQQLLEKDTIKYHPLLMEYAAGNATGNDSDVSSVSRAVWSLSSALSEVQRHSSCRRGGTSDCVRREEVGRALLRQGFDREGTLSSIRYALKGFTEEGHIAKLGFYSDDEGLNLEPGVLATFSEPMDTRWKIFEQDDPFLQALPDDALQSVSSSPEVSSEKRKTSSNMISLTSHQEQTEKHEERRSSPPLSAWLGRPWSLAVLGTSAFVSLSSLYVLVFLLVKACEGDGGGCWLAVLQLLALVCLCGGATLHTWKPAPLVCGLQRAIHNTGLVFCYGGLLLKGMCLRSQSSLGLGGSLNRGNQLLTLLFVVGVQAALETQWWLLRTLDQGAVECERETLASHAYAAILLLTATAVALSTKRLPYNQSESRSLIGSTLACSLIFACWCVACWLLPSTLVAAPATLLATAVAVLLGVFLPQLVFLHRHGSFHKPLVPSYADSLSTVFTMFNNNSTLTGRGKKKTLDYQEE